MPDPEKLQLLPVGTDPEALDLIPANTQPDKIGPDNRSFAQKAWDWSEKPLLPQIGETAHEITKYVPNNDLENQSLNDFIPGLGTAKSMYEGLQKGITEGVGDTLSGLSTPQNIALTAAGMGSEGAAARGFGQTAKALKWGERALSAPVVYSGGQKVLDPNTSWGDKALGLTEMAGGLGGAFSHMPEVRQPHLHSIADTAHGEPPPPGAPPSAPPVSLPNTETGPPAVGGGATVKIKVPNQETVNALKEQGFNFIAVDDNGAIVMHKPHVPSEPTVEHIDPEGNVTNASGESMASAEAMSRQSGMKSRGEQFGVFDRSGNFRPLIGPDAVDYRARQGETYGVMGQSGFRVLDDKGGRVGETPLILDDGKPPAHMTDEGPISPDIHDINTQDFGDLSNFDYGSLEHSEAPANPYEIANQGHIAEAAQIPPETLPGPNSPIIPPVAKPWDVRPGGNEAHIADMEAQNQTSLPAPNYQQQQQNQLPAEFQPNDAFARQALGEPEPLFPRTPKPEDYEPQGHVVKNTLYQNFADDAQRIKDEMKRGKNFDQAYEETTGNYETDQHYEDMYNHVLGDNATKQEMRVDTPGNKGNVAVGGADPRVLDVIGSSLYSKSGPTVTTKELLQNSFDEHREHGITTPIKVNFNHFDKLNGDTHPSVQVRDHGKGLTPEEIYTTFTDVGKTGKGGIESASGGFGFAKAAPLLGGEHVIVHSIVDEKGKRVKYTFEGSPAELKDQTKGVALERNVVDKSVPTGLSVKTFYPKGTGLSEAKHLAKNMTNYSPSVTSDVHVNEDYIAHSNETKRWLNTEPMAPKGPYDAEIQPTIHSKEPMPPMVGNISVPGADINFYHPDIEQGSEHSQYALHTLNKGLFQSETGGRYGWNPVPNVPPKVIADIHANVEEGHPKYPFSANREQVAQHVKDAIDEWVNENITKGAQKNRIDALQKEYDTIKPLSGNMHYLDDGGRFTPQELTKFQRSPALRQVSDALEIAHKSMLDTADQLGWHSDVFSGAFTPSARLKKFGYLFQAPTTRGTTLGIHIPSPANLDNSAILINLMEHLNRSDWTRNPAKAIDRVTTGLYATMTHEDAHIPGGGHDEGFAGRHATLLDELGKKNTNDVLDIISNAFKDANGQPHPEISELLRVYNDSRLRDASKTNAVLATGVSEIRPTNRPGGETANDSGIKSGKDESESVKDKFLKGVQNGQTIVLKTEHSNPANVKQLMQNGFEFKGVSEDGRLRFTKTGKVYSGPVLESEVGQSRPRLGPDTNQSQSNLAGAYNLPRAVMASTDFSAPMRQGLGLVHKAAFWKALPGMVKSWGSEEVFQAIQKEISERPLFKQRVGQDGKLIPSFAQDAGLKLTDMNDVNIKEEAFMSNLAQRAIPGVRRSERAYIAFLNKLRADTFESVIKNYNIISPQGHVNIPEARGLAEFVNVATGRGDLGRLEGAASTLNQVLFSPRLMASRVQMLNPAYYIMAGKAQRIEAIKSLLAVAAAGNIVLQLGQMAGGKVETDPSSSDFGKLRVGNTRIDPWGGFQQYVVAAQRLIRPPHTGIGQATHTGIVPLDLATGFMAAPGMHLKSTNTGRTMDLINKKKPFDPTIADTAERFARGKLHPVLNFAWSLADGAKEMSGAKMNLTTPNPMDNAITQRFIPMVMQDTYDLYKKEPDMLPAAGLAAVGMGVQTYGPNDNKLRN